LELSLLWSKCMVFGGQMHRKPAPILRRRPELHGADTRKAACLPTKIKHRDRRGRRGACAVRSLCVQLCSTNFTLHRHTVTMVAIQVYKISTAKYEKLPKHCEIVQEQEINPNGFAYARDMPKVHLFLSTFVPDTTFCAVNSCVQSIQLTSNTADNRLNHVFN